MKEIKDKLGSKNNFIFGIVLITILFTIAYGVFVTAQSGGETTYGPTWKTTCDADGNCQTIIFSYQKYWLNEIGDYEEIDESFDTINCEINYDFCVDRNLYQVHAKQFPDTAETIKYIKNGSAFRFQPFTLNYRNANDQLQQINIIQSVPISVNDNQISYPNAFVQGTDLNYVYLPRTLKQELVIANNLTLPVPEDYIMAGEDITLDVDFQIIVDNDIDIYVNGEIWNNPPYQDVITSNEVLFKRGDEVLFIIPKPIAFDNQGDFVILEYEFKKQGNNLYTILKTPYEWLVDTAEYPVFIDPTVIIGDINWNGRVVKDPTIPVIYTRTNNPATLSLGLVTGDGQTARGDIDWNVSSIPNDSDILNATLQLFIEDANTNNFINITHMEGNSTTYPDTIAGNKNFYDDMGDGTVYASNLSLSGTNFFLNLSFNAEGRSDIEAAGEAFSTGIDIDLSIRGFDISARDNSNATRRPKMTIIYTTAPSIEFVLPTPDDGSTQSNKDIYVNISSSDANDHYTFVDFDNDVFLWMRMDDTNSSGDPTDLSSYSNNGTLNGDAFINSSGYFGNTSWFDGLNDATDDYIQLVGIDGGDVRFNSSFSVSMWVKQVSQDATREMIGIDSTSCSSAANEANRGWTVRVSTAERVQLCYHNGTTRAFANGPNSNLLTSDVWRHVVAVYDSSTPSITVYHDAVAGAATTTGVPVGGGTVPTKDLRIGAADNFNRIWNGTIDEVLIFNRSLSADEISALYNASTNQYFNNFTGLSVATHTFTGHAVDVFANRNQTEDRNVTIGINETDSDAAIEQGINNSLVGPNNPIQTDQQIYLLNETGGHFLGTFDKTTIKNNQTWAFNYVTSQESFINIPSLFNILNVWENQSLSFDEIVSQVETFINNTIY